MTWLGIWGVVKATDFPSATRRVTEGAEAMPGKEDEKTMSPWESWFSSFLLTMVL